MNRVDVGREVIRATRTGQLFQSYTEFENKVVEEFNKRLDLFPPTFSHNDLIHWAFEKSWVGRTKDGQFYIKNST